MSAAEAEIGIDPLAVALVQGDSRRLIELVLSWPPNDQRDGVLDALGRPYREMQSMGLVMLAMGYSTTDHAALGLRIAQTVEVVGTVACERSAEANMVSAVAWASATAATCRATLGRSEELVAEAESALRWLAAHHNLEKHCELHLVIATTHLAGGRLAEAECHLVEAERAPLAEEAFGTRGRLRDARERHTTMAGQLATELPAAAEAVGTRSRDSLAGQLDAAAHLAADVEPVLTPIIGDVRAGLDAYLADPLGPAGAALEALADHFGAADRPFSRLGLQQRIREAGRILVDPVAGRDPDVLQQWAADLRQMAVAAEEQGLGNDLMTILWCLQLCHGRRGEHDAAAAVLRALWERLEAVRATIADPVKRAGVLAEFPALFPAMARNLFLAERPADLLEAIEGAKGRLMADVLDAHRADTAVGLREPASLAALPAALAEAGVHYLTYLVDDDCTYAVLVASDRSLHAARIDIDRDTLRAYGAFVDPSTWGTRARGIAFPAVASDLPVRLAPLVSWLEPLVSSGVIKADEHVCYCPDDDLHLVPLHLLNLAGAPMLAHVSLSRVHSARAVLALLSAPSRPPRAAAVIEVPAAGDDDDMTAGFRTVGDCLLAELPGERIRDEHATLDRVCSLDLTGRLVHFTTHGTFPSPRNRGVDPNPFRSSGILLAADGALPQKKAISFGESTGGLLSPEVIGRLRLTGSHVTMQACSTGLSKEGSGGDALGLEWAFLLAGAASALTSHWEVPLTSSSEFVLRFYDSWLVDGTTRAGAWRSAALGMLHEGAPPEEWSGFSLAGDWR